MPSEDDGSSSSQRRRGRIRTQGRERLPIVCVERPRCPRCASSVLRKYRSIADSGDDTAMWWVECAECQQRFKVVLE